MDDTNTLDSELFLRLAAEFSTLFSTSTSLSECVQCVESAVRNYGALESLLVEISPSEPHIRERLYARRKALIQCAESVVPEAHWALATANALHPIVDQVLADTLPMAQADGVALAVQAAIYQIETALSGFTTVACPDTAPSEGSAASESSSDPAVRGIELRTRCAEELRKVRKNLGSLVAAHRKLVSRAYGYCVSDTHPPQLPPPDESDPPDYLFGSRIAEHVTVYQLQLTQYAAAHPEVVADDMDDVDQINNRHPTVSQPRLVAQLAHKELIAIAMLAVGLGNCWSWTVELLRLGPDAPEVAAVEIMAQELSTRTQRVRSTVEVVT